MKPHIVDFFKFLENKENRKVPFKVRLFNPDKFGPFNEDDGNVYVLGNLTLRYEKKLNSLPDNLTVAGSLDLYETSIQSLPKNLTVKGDLQMSNSKIESLSDNLTVRGHFHMASTPVEYLPDNLTVQGSLDIQRTKINSIPNNLKVGGDLSIDNTPLAKRMTDEEIRQEIEQKGGYLKGKRIYR